MQYRTFRPQLVVKLLVACCSLPSLGSQLRKHSHFELPPEAVVHMGVSTSDEQGVSNSECSFFRFSETAVRRRFRTYHVLVEGEEHLDFETLPCRMTGTIELRGHQYLFVMIEGNMLRTNYPGPEVVQLGGDGTGGRDTPPPSDTDVIPDKRRKHK